MTESPVIISAKSSSKLTNAPIYVLHVDDDSGFLKVTKKLLEVQHAFQVDTALSVDEAMSKMKKTTYDVVVSDYQMSGKDGLDFLKELRAEENDVSFILFTGKGRESIAIQALNLGADRYFNKMGDPETVYGELAHGIRQAVEKKRAEVIIQQQNEFLENTLESLTHPFYIIDAADYTIQLANSATGFDASVKGLTCYEFTHKRGIPCADEHVCPLEEVKKTKKPVVVEHLHHDENGHVVSVEVHGYPIFDDDGNVVQIIEYTLDITERKKAEAEEKKAKEHYLSITNLTGDIIANVDREGRWTFLNDVACAFWGKPRKELLGKKFRDYLHPEDSENTAAAAIQETIETRQIVRGVMNRQRTPRGWRVVEWNGVPLFDAAGDYVGYQATGRDVTEHMKAEEALAKSEKKYRELVETSPDMIYTLDPKGKFLFTNKTWNNRVGFSKEEIERMNGFELIHPEDYKVTIERFSDVLEGKGVENVEFRSRVKDGSYINVLTNGSPVLDPQGNVVAVLGVARDITERKKVENSLRNRLQFESMVSKISANLINAPMSELDKTVSEALKIICQFMDAERCSIFLFSDNCTKLTNTHEWCSNPKDSQMSLLQGLPVDVFGYYFNILKKLKMIVINRPDDLPNEAKNERKWSEEHGFRPLVFVPMIHKGALYGTVGYYGKVDKEQVWSKDAIEYLNILSDIFVNAMEHKRFEEEIKGLARFPSENPNPVLRITKDGTILYANAASKSLLQEWRSEVNGFVPDEWSRHVSNVFHSGESQEIEIEYDERVHSFVLTPVVDGSYVNAYSRDITERKKAENALHESEEKYRVIFEGATDGILCVDVKTKRFAYVNPRICEITGYSSNELLRLSVAEIHPERDLPYVLNQFEKQVQGKISLAKDIPVLRKDRSVIYCDVNSKILKIGKQEYLVGFFRDVTERRMREEEMRRRLMRFRLDDGNLYLVTESNPALSLEAFKDLLDVGYRGLVLSRTPEEEYKKKVDGSFEFRWLAERGGEKSLSKFDEIEISLDKLEKKSVVLLDCLDYLVLKNGFKETLFFVQHLREFTHLTDNVVILSVDPSTLNAREVRLLEKEGREVEPQIFVRLPEDLMEILRFIYEHNALGSKPNYTDIRQELSISKPTVGKRIKSLINTGYVTENPRGRSKVLELTYKGMRLFLK